MVNYRDEKMLRVNHSFKAVRSVGHRSRRSQGARLAYTGFPRNKAPSQLSRREWLSDSTAVSERDGQPGALRERHLRSDPHRTCFHPATRNLNCVQDDTLFLSYRVYTRVPGTCTDNTSTRTFSRCARSHARCDHTFGSRLDDVCVPQKSFDHWSCLC